MDLGKKKSIFVIGFPKSGNTWLARLLSEATQSKIEATNVFDGAENSPNRKGPYIICKRHDSVDTVLTERSRAVYIIRDIRDVLVSAFFFNNGFIHEDWVKHSGISGRMIRGLSKLYFWHQVMRMNRKWCGNELAVIMDWIHRRKSTIGNWSEHVSYWANNRSVIVVRYEDLLKNTESEMKRILRSLEIVVSNEKLRKTILNQDFKKKKAEFIRVNDSTNAQFLRSGESGGWRNFLSPVMVKSIEKKHAAVMKKYGYKLEGY